MRVRGGRGKSTPFLRGSACTLEKGAQIKFDAKSECGVEKRKSRLLRSSVVVGDQYMYG